MKGWVKNGWPPKVGLYYNCIFALIYVGILAFNWYRLVNEDPNFWTVFNVVMDACFICLFGWLARREFKRIVAERESDIDSRRE
jgi:hypothetical protein